MKRTNLEIEPGTKPPEGARVIQVYGGKEPARKGQPQQPGITIKRIGRKVGRNEPCPCGSGKKFKTCHDTGGKWELAEPKIITPEEAKKLNAVTMTNYRPPEMTPVNGADIGRSEGTEAASCVGGGSSADEK